MFVVLLACGPKPLQQTGVTDDELVTSRSLGCNDSVDQLSYSSIFITTDEDGTPKVVRIFPPSDIEWSVSPSEIDNRVNLCNVDYDTDVTSE